MGDLNKLPGTRNMEDKIIETEAYVEFEQRHNRFLNMLAEDDRNLRK